MRPLVLDTNIVLDAFVFRDEAVRPVLDAMAQGTLRWLATGEMREELARVLDYPQIARRLASAGRPAAEVLASFDACSHLAEAAPRAAVRCGDPDDQKFIDLAVRHGAILLSKDFEVLRMRKRLERLGAQVCKAWPGAAPAAEPVPAVAG